jgi:exonuclease SbcD
MSELKILHTSDWHLGKKLFKQERIDEQSAFLDWLHDYIIDNEVDVLLVAGDIFDVPSPPVNAIKLLYNFIFKLGETNNTETFIITGNHDSSSLLEVPKKFFGLKNCHIFSSLEQNMSKMNYLFKKNGINIGIKSLPYFRNFELINLIDNDEDDQELAIKNYFSSFFEYWENPTHIHHKILLSHHGFGKYSAAGSEHAIYLSGLDYFPLEWVKDKFDYVALGHIHKKQLLSESPPILYPGSPIPLRFSESNDKKVSLLTATKTELKFDLIDIPNFRQLTSLKTTSETYITDITKLLKNIEKKPLECFLEVNIKILEPTAGIADHIREILIDSGVQLISYIPTFELSEINEKENKNINKLSIEELFTQYYKVKFEEEEIPKNILKSFNSLVIEIKNENS